MADGGHGLDFLLSGKIFYNISSLFETLGGLDFCLREKHEKVFKMFSFF